MLSPIYNKFQSYIGFWTKGDFLEIWQIITIIYFIF